MNDSSRFDYVWLGLLIGVFDLGDREQGMMLLLNHLEDMGLTSTRMRLIDEEEREEDFDSDEIAGWVSEELDNSIGNQQTVSGVSIHDSTNLVHSMPPGVFSWLPASAQADFVEAEKSLHGGNLNGAALLLVRITEVAFRHFYQRLQPNPESNLDWALMETSLLRLGQRDIVPAVHLVKDLRINDRNPAVHGEKQYDIYEVIALWHETVLAVTRMAKALERRFPFPTDEQHQRES